MSRLRSRTTYRLVCFATLLNDRAFKSQEIMSLIDYIMNRIETKYLSFAEIQASPFGDMRDNQPIIRTCRTFQCHY